MREHYQVKFVQNGKTIYGLVYDNGKGQFADPEAKKWAAKGKLIVADAILPKSHVVDEKDLIDIELSSDYNQEKGCMNDEYGNHVADEYDKAKKLSDSIKGFGVGKMFYLGVADGTAHYVVTKVFKATCEVEWRGFCPDRYSDQILGWGGRFPTSRIRPLIEREEGIRSIFSKTARG